MTHLDDTDIVMTKNSNVPLDHQDCKSYNIHAVGESMTGIELEIDGLLGFKSVVTVPHLTEIVYIIYVKEKVTRAMVAKEEVRFLRELCCSSEK